MLTGGAELQAVVGVEFGHAEWELVMDKQEDQPLLVVMLEGVKG